MDLSAQYHAVEIFDFVVDFVVDKIKPQGYKTRA